MSAPRGGWLWPAIALVAGVTALRLCLLAFDRTDLFVDEAQYWLWSRDFAFGYFSKPPLIAWLIRVVTTLAGSQDIFWVRMPAAVLHGATALILAALGARIADGRTALWVAGTYLTLPMTTVGSLLITTDTVMAPFFAASLFFLHRLLGRHHMADAVLVGLMAGLACLAKYAGIYLLAGLFVAILLRKDLRPRLVELLVIMAVWLLILAPNLIWNATHGLSTFAHTGDNIGWIEQSNKLANFGFGEVFDFWGAQIAVVGPIVLAALLSGIVTPRGQPLLAIFSAIPLLVVSVQALLDQANANWAVAAYFPGAVLAVMVLSGFPHLRLGSLLANTVIAVALPFLTLFPDFAMEDAPLLNRYVGRAEVSRQIITLSEAAGTVPVVSDIRDVMADLFYTGRDSAQQFFTPPPQGRPKSHYEDRYPLPADLTGRVLLVTRLHVACPAEPLALRLTGTPYARNPIRAYLVKADCARHLAQGRPD